MTEEKPQPAAEAMLQKVEPKPEQQPVVKKERPANCAACNKSIKKLRWYYRNGKYYCTPRCWKTTRKKEEAPKTGQAETKPRID